jgi:hypothetical protein
VLISGTATVRAGSSRTLRAVVTDDRALARLEVRVDGRLARTWILAGTRADRWVVISSTWLRVGSHRVVWTARDLAGLVRTRSFVLLVR